MKKNQRLRNLNNLWKRKELSRMWESQKKQAMLTLDQTVTKPTLSLKHQEPNRSQLEEETPRSLLKTNWLMMTRHKHQDKFMVLEVKWLLQLLWVKKHSKDSESLAKATFNKIQFPSPGLSPGIISRWFVFSQKGPILLAVMLFSSGRRNPAWLFLEKLFLLQRFFGTYDRSLTFAFGWHQEEFFRASAIGREDYCFAIRREPGVVVVTGRIG